MVGSADAERFIRLRSHPVMTCWVCWSVTGLCVGFSCRNPHHETLKGESEGTICLETDKFARFPITEDTVTRLWLKTSRISSAVLRSGEGLVRPHCCSKEFHRDRET